jgi:hypothetical protein
MSEVIVVELKKAKTVDPRTGTDIVIIQALHKNMPVMGLRQHPANHDVWLEEPITRAERRRVKKALAEFTQGAVTCN